MADKQVALPVVGMSCAACVAHVERALSGVEGVTEANVNLATERASVVYNPEVVDLERMLDAVQQTGGPE